MEKKLSVSAIKNGSVIDHVTAGNALKIVRLLDLPSGKTTVTIGLNLPSKRLGYKDIIKVSGKEITQKEANKISVLAPQMSVNVIKNYKIKKKFKVEIPEIVKRVAVCPNPVCVTNQETIASVFKAKKQKYSILLICKYCQKQYTPNQINEYHT